MSLALVWVFRLTFFPSLSSSSPPSHLQLFVSLRYRKRCRGRGSLAVYATLFLVCFYPQSLEVGLLAFRWTFFPSPSCSSLSPHNYLLVVCNNYISYKKKQLPHKSCAVHCGRSLAVPSLLPQSVSMGIILVLYRTCTITD